jgi:hypothetical protein
MTGRRRAGRAARRELAAAVPERRPFREPLTAAATGSWVLVLIGVLLIATTRDVPGGHGNAMLADQWILVIGPLAVAVTVIAAVVAWFRGPAHVALALTGLALVGFVGVHVLLLWTDQTFAWGY